MQSKMITSAPYSSARSLRNRANASTSTIYLLKRPQWFSTLESLAFSVGTGALFSDGAAALNGTVLPGWAEEDDAPSAMQCQ